MTSIIAKDLQDKMLSVSAFSEVLATTEPLSAVEFDMDGSVDVDFNLVQGWNGEDVRDLPGTEVVDATLRVGGTEMQLTKDALLQATSLIGLQREYVMKSPASLIQPQLDYWMKSMPTRTLKVLHREGEAQAFTKASVVPVSNLALMDTALEGLHKEYGIDPQDVLVDYKAHHDLRSTTFRLVVPEEIRNIASARSDTNDRWSVGLEIQNSLTASVPTRMNGYLFAWICTNGMTSQHSASGSYSRKSSPTEEAALAWAAESVDDILSGLEHEFTAIEELVNISLEGDVNATMRDIFDRHRVPVRPREAILAEMVEGNDLTAYGVMAAITQAANHTDLPASEVSRLLQIGGALPMEFSHRCGTCSRLSNN
jgi:hypothetical protein